MIYLYTLPSSNFSYPDIKNILYSTYLKNNSIRYKMYDYTDYFLNNMLVNDNLEKLGYDIDKIKHDIKDKNKDLLEVNKKFIKAVNKYLEEFGINYINNHGFAYNYLIRNIDDLINVEKEISEFIDNFPLDNYKNNDIIFLNVSYGFQVPMALGLTKRIKNSNSNVKIIWGGNYLTQINKNCNELIRKAKVIDAIIIFNHIKTFADIIKYYSKEKVDLCNVITAYKEYEISKDIKDSISDYYLDYNDIDLNIYLSRDKIMPILLNYGCYYHRCNFCAHFYHYGNYMKMNIKKTCEMIKKMYRHKKFDSIVFVDECIPPEMMVDISKYFIDNDINIKWMFETRINKSYLNFNTVKLLSDAGCKFVSFGIESYNNKILKLMDKGIDTYIIKKTLKNFYNAGIVVSSTFMIGYPKESYFNIFRTLNFISRFKYIDIFGLNVFVLARNSFLCDNINHDCSGIHLTYRFKGDNKERLEKILKIFNQKKKLKKFNNIKSCLLNRSDYLYIDRENFSINYRKV